MKKRNLKVELIRIIACMAVIWYHIRRLPFKADGSLSETAVFFECICTICVMTFFLITGFYIYEKKGNLLDDWFSLIIGFFKKVFPLFIIAIVVSLIFHDYFISSKTILECLKSFDIIYILNSIIHSITTLSVNYLPGTCGHLWYVYAYFFIILFYPLTRLFLKKSPKIVVYLVLFIFLLWMILNDYCLFFDNPKYNFIFEIIKKPVIYSAVGHVLYNDFIKNYLNNFSYKIGVISAVIYIVTFILLFKTQVAYDLTTNGEYVYTAWLSTYSLVLTSAFIIFIYNLNISYIYNTKFESFIYYLSKKTYSIYIVHYFLITKLLTVGFQNIFFDNLKYFIQHLLYHIFYSLLIFLLSYLFILFVEKTIFIVDKLYRRFVWQKEKTI